MSDGPTLTDVIKKAWLEPDYKARLLENPAEAIRELGGNPPDDIELVVIESKPNRKVLILPPLPELFHTLTPAQIAGISYITDTSGPTTFGGMKTCTKIGNPIGITLPAVDLPVDDPLFHKR